MRWHVGRNLFHRCNHLRQRSFPHPAATGPGKEIRAGDHKSINISVRQASVDSTPACPSVGGKKDAAIGPGKEIRAGHYKSINMSVRQASIDNCPVSTVVGGTKDSAGPCARKKIRAACPVGGDGKSKDTSIR